MWITFMSIFPVRNFSKYGVITDVDPYSLPLEAWSMGVNVRFHAGAIERSPVFRNVIGLATASPRYITANTPSTGFSTVVQAYLNGTVAQISNGTETDISITSYTPANAESCFTSCHLGDVFYVNRDDRVPWSLRTSDSNFQVLANWDSGWRAGIFRSAGGALCAFNITKSGTAFPTMVKTSEFALADTVPTTWDATDPTNNATENILAEMRGGITDAQNLGEIVVIYGLEEAWAMTADGSEEVWSYHKLFDDAGSINANCSIEIDKQHYVFGLHDIWRHDGTSKASIADQRTRDFIFQSINMQKSNRCFVYYNEKLKEVYFCYASADAYTGFPMVDGCNRCAAYNIAEDNWSFYDLPYVYGAAEANIDTVATWTSVTLTWATAGGSWLDQDDSLKRITVMCGDVNAAASVSRSLYAFDLQGPGTVVALPVDENATLGWTLERDGIDLDEVGVDLRGYKLCSSIYPQARLEVDAEPLSFQVGTNDYFSQLPIMSPAQTYDGNLLYKLDFNVSGRYMKMIVKHDDWHYVRFGGLDFDLDVLGER
jgi:hypothetical protein